MTIRALKAEPTSSLWMTRIYFFLFIGGSGFIMPFITLFYNRQGLSGEQIGMLATIGSLISLVMAPLSGMISSKMENPRRLLQIGLLSSAGLMLILSQQSTFLWIGILIATDAILSSGVWPISAAAAVDEIQKGEKVGYGSIRLWGSLGWAIIAVLSGFLIEGTGMFSAFVGYGISMLLAAFVLGIMTRKDNKHKNNAIRTSPWHGFRELLKDKALVGFAIAILVNWSSRLGVRQFEVLYMDTLGAQESLIGLASTLSAAVEIPIMLWVDRLIRRINTTYVLRVAFLLDILRMLLVLLFPTVQTILVTRLIGGVSFAFYAVAMVIFLSERAAANQNPTIQAIFSVTLPNIVTIIGAPLMGRIFDSQGAYIFYLIGLIGISLSLLVFILTVSGKRSGHQNQAIN